MIKNDSLLEQIQARRREVSEFLIIAVIVASLMSTATGALFSYFWPKETSSQFIFVVSSVALSVSAIIAGLLYVYCRKAVEEQEFVLLLPFQVANEEGDIRIIKGYQPTTYAQQYFQRTINKVLLKRFLENWPQKPDEFKEKTKPGTYLGDVIVELVQALLLALINRYGEHTMTSAVFYHAEYRALAWKFNQKHVDLSELPTPFNGNMFLAKSPQERRTLPRYLIPNEFMFKAKNTASAQDDNCNYKDIVLASKFGSLTFKILPHWSLVKGGTHFRKAIEWMRAPKGFKNLWIVAIPVEIRMVLRGWKVFHQDVESYYKWMKGLMEDTLRFMDWETYCQRQFENKILNLRKIDKSK
ncbi:MAG: hypothetical protein SVY10_15195 [Thermodesulfobacteriota bacterium]|nr:hypothetical protein [Thermodesulfobacteriota bacterium]